MIAYSEFPLEKYGVPAAFPLHAVAAMADDDEDLDDDDDDLEDDEDTDEDDEDSAVTDMTASSR